MKIEQLKAIRESLKQLVTYMLKDPNASTDAIHEIHDQLFIISEEIGLKEGSEEDAERIASNLPRGDFD